MTGFGGPTPGYVTIRSKKQPNNKNLINIDFYINNELKNANM